MDMTAESIFTFLRKQSNSNKSSSDNTNLLSCLVVYCCKRVPRVISFHSPSPPEDIVFTSAFFLKVKLRRRGGKLLDEVLVSDGRKACWNWAFWLHCPRFLSITHVVLNYIRNIAMFLYFQDCGDTKSLPPSVSAVLLRMRLSIKRECGTPYITR